jgi:hypothetical protein
VLFEAVVLENNARAPIPVLLLPTVFKNKAASPRAALLPPVVVDVAANRPTAVFESPVVLAAKALAPTAVLVATAPAPLPTVIPSITAPPVRVDTPVTPKVVDAEIDVAATVLGVVAPKVPFIAAPVSVLLVSVSVVALPTKVSVAAGSVMVVVPATAVACNVVVPEVEPERSIALGFRVTVVAIFFLYGVPFAIILVAEVITPVEDIEAIVVTPYLNSNLPPDSSIVKLVDNNLGVDAAVPVVF